MDRSIWGAMDGFGTGTCSSPGLPPITTDVTVGPHYAHPLTPKSPIEQGFALRVRVDDKPPQLRELDGRGFSDITFRGEYPVGKVQYRDPDLPVTVAWRRFRLLSRSIRIPPGCRPRSCFSRSKTPAAPKSKSMSPAGCKMQFAWTMISPPTESGRNRISSKERLLVLECSAEGPSPQRASGETSGYRL